MNGEEIVATHEGIQARAAADQLVVFPAVPDRVDLTWPDEDPKRGCCLIPAVL